MSSGTFVQRESSQERKAATTDSRGRASASMNKGSSDLALLSSFSSSILAPKS